jgi:hypothetical protein
MEISAHDHLLKKEEEEEEKGIESFSSNSVFSNTPIRFSPGLIQSFLCH